MLACLRLHPKIKKCESGLYALKKWRQRNHKTPGDETGKVLDDIATDETTDISSKPFSVRASLAAPSISAFDPNTPSGKFESELREKIKAIDLIGELPIDESSFRELCDVIQQEWKVGGRLLMKKDRLYDMIRYHQGRRLEVYIEIREVSWRLFEVQRWPQILRTQVEYNVTPSESHLIFSCSLRRAWPGNLIFQLHHLNNPFASPQLLSQSNLLERVHILPCRLSPGNYWLEILSDGERLPLDPAQMQCLVGTARISKSALKSLDMVQLLDYSLR